jgi:hypothetical protein
MNYRQKKQKLQGGISVGVGGHIRVSLFTPGAHLSAALVVHDGSLNNKLNPMARSLKLALEMSQL